MIAVDDYIRRNGKSMFVMAGEERDSEFDRMARTRCSKPRREDISDLMGRTYRAEDNAWPIYTTPVQQVSEDSF